MRASTAALMWVGLFVAGFILTRAFPRKYKPWWHSLMPESQRPALTDNSRLY